MAAIDWDKDVHDHVLDLFCENDPVSYSPLVSSPGSTAFDVTAIFDRQHEIILTEIKASELEAPGHSTTAPVLTVKLADFAANPKIGDHVTIDGETFDVYDEQPDGFGMADLVLRKVR